MITGMINRKILLFGKRVEFEDIATGDYKLWDVAATNKDRNLTAEDTLRFWEDMTVEVKEYLITIESIGTGQVWSNVNHAASETPIRKVEQ